MILNNNEIAAAKDCFKRYIERHSNKTHKMLLPKLEVIGGLEND